LNRWTFLFGSICALLLSFVGLIGRAIAATTGRPNILVFVTDDQKWDTLGSYGNKVIRTPNIDRIANEGVLFKYAFVQVPQCVPSRASLLTGRYPQAHRVRWNSIPLPDDEVTIGELLNDAGYQTAAFGKLHIPPQNPQRLGFQYSRTHGEYNRYLAEQGIKGGMHASKGPYVKLGGKAAVPGTFPYPKEHYITNWIGDRAVEYLREVRDPDKPFFMYVSFFRPHVAWNPPEPYDTMYDPKDIPLPPTPPEDLDGKPASIKAYRRIMGTDKMTEDELRAIIALHYGLVTLVDDNVGKLLNALDEAGVAENTIVVYLTDNGTLLGDHELIRKGLYIYDGNSRTPLVMRWPQHLPAGKELDALAEEIDVMPTLLAATGLDIPARVQGMNLLPVIEGRRLGKDAAFTQIGFEANRCITSIRTRKWRYVYYTTGEGELYDHENDPYEITNLFGNPEYKDVVYELQERLLRWRTEIQDRWPTPISKTPPPRTKTGSRSGGQAVRGTGSRSGAQ